MQLKFFQIPALGDAAINAEINKFLRGQKVLQLETHLVNNPAGAYWAICAKYVENKEACLGNWNENSKKSGFWQFLKQ